MQEQTFSFDDRLSLLAGARWAEFSNLTNNYRTGASNRAGGDAPNSRFGAVWLPRDGVSVYVVNSEIQVASTVADLDGTTFDPVTSELVEAGVRFELADKRVTLTLSYFDLVQNNVLQSDPARLGCRIQTGESSSNGVELDLTASPLVGWQILGSASLLKAEVSGDVNPARIGLRVPNTPDQTFSVWNKYMWQSDPLDGFGVGCGIIHVSDRVGDANNSFLVPSYTRLDLSVSYVRERWAVDVNLRNALDEDYIESVSSRTAVRPGTPTNFLARLRYRF
ncbi:MAG: TonB-dependent receptor [Candidatus Synoicihabitans palmerolidicus]|nr:TonB-dependent receptor [Candidatus Synoicihabitans palmerolidicus]